MKQFSNNKKVLGFGLIFAMIVIVLIVVAGGLQYVSGTIYMAIHAPTSNVMMQLAAAPELQGYTIADRLATSYGADGLSPGIIGQNSNHVYSFINDKDGSDIRYAAWSEYYGTNESNVVDIEMNPGCYKSTDPQGLIQSKESSVLKIRIRSGVVQYIVPINCSSKVLSGVVEVR